MIAATAYGHAGDERVGSLHADEGSAPGRQGYPLFGLQHERHNAGAGGIHVDVEDAHDRAFRQGKGLSINFANADALI